MNTIAPATIKPTATMATPMRTAHHDLDRNFPPLFRGPAENAVGSLWGKESLFGGGSLGGAGRIGQGG